MSTVSAISTPLSSAGLGVIRISGGDALSVGDKMFRSFGNVSLSDMKGYHCAYGRVFDKDGDIDEAVATVFRASKSYTGEDTVEFSCHGSVALLKRVLRATFDAGALPAGPGEFTKRAFLNGKMTLTQAEGVMDLISSKSKGAGKAALAMRDGALYKKIRKITSELTALQSHFAAWSDYPEEDVPELSEDSMGEVLTDCDSVLKNLMASYDAGRIIREGASVVIAGKPNVGKSTLMNLISGRDRSIVTEIAGTTRDVVEEMVLVGDIPVRLLDTAGIHETEDLVEKIGVDMANSALDRCDAVIAVFDASSMLTDDDMVLIEKLKDKPTLAVINKTDLDTVADTDLIKRNFDYCVEISAQKGEGTDNFQKAFTTLLKLGDFDYSEPIMANERQLDCVRRGEKAISEALDALSFGMTLDAVGICVETALDALYELTGEKASDAVIEQVFANFCVGK